MIAWPESLPQCPAREFQLVPINGQADAEEQLSPYRVRTYPEHSATFSFKALSTEEMQALRTFYDLTLNQCAPFTAPWLPQCGLEHHFCQCSGPPTIERTGTHWSVSLPVVIYSGVPMDEAGNITYGERE